MANAIGNDLSQFAPMGNNSVGGGEVAVCQCITPLRYVYDSDMPYMPVL